MREDETLSYRGELPIDGDDGVRRVLWLRQSVTFAVNGQTRTLEMALPVRPGAPAEELEALLDEADAGMRRLSRRLDAHIADALRADHAEQPAREISDLPPVSAPVASVALIPAPLATPYEQHPTDPAARGVAETPAPVSQPQSMPQPAPAAPAIPVATPIPAPAASVGRPGQTPSQPPARPQPSPPTPPAAVEADISRPEFL
ncbi:MAG TPA: hypothetical protein VKQ36_14395, partial [Ktedonobacterales bacterium]|nr:hypothetical protein [Ktedonobacterales bacterium]